jgi:hypothetical protein
MIYINAWTDLSLINQPNKVLNIKYTELVSAYILLHHLSISFIPCFFCFYFVDTTYIPNIQLWHIAPTTYKQVTYILNLVRNLLRHLPVLLHIHTIITAFFNCLSNYHNTYFRYHMSTSHTPLEMTDNKRFIKRITIDFVTVRSATYPHHLQFQTSNDLSNVLQSITSLFDQLTQTTISATRV